MKVSEIKGETLDYWVSRALGYRYWLEQRGVYRLAVKQSPGTEEPYKNRQRWEQDKDRYTEVTSVAQLICGFFGDGIPKFSSDWTHGGPIIDKYDIDFVRLVPGYRAQIWVDNGDGSVSCGFGVGDTRLQAAMRALVDFKFGYEVQETS